MKDEKMTIWGVGPKIGRGTLLVAIVIYALQYFFFPDFKIPISQSLAYIIGGVWFVLGIPIWLNGGEKINKNFEKGKLATSGILKYIQHPIYCAFILFYIPGLVLMSRSWIGFVIPFAFYFFFRKYIGTEERWLKEKFGEEYLIYKNKTGKILPKIKRINKNKKI
jgi:protein-S-isoprenylcysteine O-methyltransferase Ste14